MEAQQKVIEAIKRFDSFIITSHINPEGDSLGSQLAMAELLRFMGKEFVIFNNNEVPKHYRFLPRASMVRDKLDAKTRKFNAAIVLDCPNLKRTGKVKSLLDKTKYIINIDHHVSNGNFGSLNWVEEGASSTGEMVYSLYKEANCKITKDAALVLYIAILTDTGSFNYANTSGITHEIAGELIGCGVEPYEVSKKVYGNRSRRSIELLGRTLAGLKFAAGGKIAYITVRKVDFKNTKAKPIDCEDFVNFPRSIEGVWAALFFREDIEKKNVFHVGFRAKKKVNVNKVASFFGGGGHRSASGCVVGGTFPEVKKKVLKRLIDEL